MSLISLEKEIDADEADGGVGERTGGDRIAKCTENELPAYRMPGQLEYRYYLEALNSFSGGP